MGRLMQSYLTDDQQSQQVGFTANMGPLRTSVIIAPADIFDDTNSNAAAN
jgi:hypothetical protein